MKQKDKSDKQLQDDRFFDGLILGLLWGIFLGIVFASL